MLEPVVAVETTQWVIAMGSLGSALIALALGLGLPDWVVRPRVRLALRHESHPEQISDRTVRSGVDRVGFEDSELDVPSISPTPCASAGRPRPHATAPPTSTRGAGA